VPSCDGAASRPPQSRTWVLGDRHSSDATVKFLQIQAHGQAPAALALEVTYHPLSSYPEAAPVLRELAGALQGALEGGGAGEAAARCAGGRPTEAAEPAHRELPSDRGQGRAIPGCIAVRPAAAVQQLSGPRLPPFAPLPCAALRLRPSPRCRTQPPLRLPLPFPSYPAA
jgi:hypothetical protein